MEEAFRLADELEPLKLVHIHRAAVGLRAVAAIDNIACGPTIGVRTAPDVSTEKPFRLTRTMTVKNAAAQLPHGGGKSVILADPKMPPSDKERLIRAFAAAIGDLTDYISGPDMGTDELAIGWIKDETGRAVALPREIGGIPLDEIGDRLWPCGRDRCRAKAYRVAAGRRADRRLRFGLGRQPCRALPRRERGSAGRCQRYKRLYRRRGRLRPCVPRRPKGRGRALYDHPRGRKLGMDVVIDILSEI